MEVVDICLPYRSDDGTLKPDSATLKWGKEGTRACELLGREIHTAHSYKKRMEEAGFVNVVERVYKWPTNKWPKGWSLSSFRFLNFFSFCFWIGCRRDR
jgi:hypothetical protein